MENITLDGKNIVIDVEVSKDFVLEPNCFSDVNLKQEILFKFSESDVKANITYRCVAYENTNVDLEIKMVSDNRDINNVQAYLEVHILNIGKKNSIKVVPCLEIANENIKFEHKVAIGAPDKKWLEYMQSRGLTKKEALNLIIQAFI